MLKRNCSITPRQLLLFYLSITVLSLAIAAAFWMHGATLVIGFTFLELAALAVALLVYARHVGDGERICLDGERLIVEVRRADAVVSRIEWPARWVRVAVKGLASGPGLIELASRTDRIEVGRYVRPQWRRPLADEFGRALRAMAQA